MSKCIPLVHTHAATFTHKQSRLLSSSPDHRYKMTVQACKLVKYSHLTTHSSATETICHSKSCLNDATSNALGLLPHGQPGVESPVGRLGHVASGAQGQGPRAVLQHLNHGLASSRRTVRLSLPTDLSIAAVGFEKRREKPLQNTNVAR